MKFILLGPQGSGKGTQATLLGTKYKIPNISTGEIFRENIKKGTELGKLAASLINDGKLVPDNVTNKLVQDRIKEKDCKNGFILDGYPRNLEQAKFFDEITNIDYVIDIELPDKETVNRLSSRRQCSKCSAIYGAVNLKKGQNKCEKCQGSLIQRKDDQPDAIKKRLDIYHKETEPLIAYYMKKGNLLQINGEQSIEKVFGDIVKAIERKLIK